ncbi:MAG: hypothetical protein ABW219_00355, partial [Ilumatobacteraceae bacterium]
TGRAGAVVGGGVGGTVGGGSVVVVGTVVVEVDGVVVVTRAVVVVDLPALVAGGAVASGASAESPLEHAPTMIASAAVIVTRRRITTVCQRAPTSSGARHGRTGKTWTTDHGRTGR